MKKVDFDAIRPYTDDEIQAVIPRIMSDPAFGAMMDYLFVGEKKQAVLEQFKGVKSVSEFQKVLTVPAIQRIIDTTTEGIESSGINYLQKDGHCVFVANHRDIMLDSSILGLTQLNSGVRVNQTTWGNNLMISQLIIDLGKSNQMITVYREGSPKELLLNSQRLSAYIRYSITELNNSVWIAQSKGRTKDGSDKTDVTILKMLSLSCSDNFIESMQQLNITPLTISYEWEPCDAMKVREVYLSQKGKYEKQPDEDFKSIIGGLLTQKGRIHLAVGRLINSEIELLKEKRLTHNEVLGEVAHLIDNQIHHNYYLWPSNYLAYDLYQGTQLYNHRYTEETKSQLEDRYQHTVEAVGVDNEVIRDLFLKLYANPVINKLKVLNE